MSIRFYVLIVSSAIAIILGTAMVAIFAVQDNRGGEYIQITVTGILNRVETQRPENPTAGADNGVGVGVVVGVGVGTGDGVGVGVAVGVGVLVGVGV